MTGPSAATTTTTTTPATSPLQRSRSRTETNLVRLLASCENMAIDTQGLADNWRLEKYVEALEVMLREVKTGPNVPEKDTLVEYSRKIDFIKGVIQAAKMPTSSEKAAAASQHLPISSRLSSSSFSASLTSPGDPNRSMEIRHRHVNKYSEDMRKELLGESSSNPQENKPEDIDELLKYHHSMQEKIAEHMIELTRNLKDQALSAGQIIKNDTEVLDKSAKLMEANQMSLKTEAERVEMYNKSACKCWVWVLLILVCTMFISMVLFMRLFKKKLHVPTS